MLLIPAIDLKDGKCVRLRQGRMDDVEVFSDNPRAMAAHWVAQGARRLHLVDLNGAVDGRPQHAELIAGIRSEQPEIEIQVGGGIRDLDTLANYSSLGVNYLVIGTQAIRDPDFLQQACASYPKQIILGLDAKQGMLAVQGWSEVSEQKALEFAKSIADLPLAAIIYTDISRDGMMQGINLEATVALARVVSAPVIASGGVRDMEDIYRLRDRHTDGISGVILGRAIYQGSINLSEALQLIST